MKYNRSHITIHTPEGCEFRLHLAGIVSRTLAYLVDLLTIFLLLFLISTALASTTRFAPDLSVILITFMAFLLTFGYGIFMEYKYEGRTVGKLILSLRVMNEQGMKLCFYQIAIRNLLKTLLLLPGFPLIDGVVFLLSNRSQRLGDLLAGTIVIRSTGVELSVLPEELKVDHNSLKAWPHLTARLRHEISPEEASTAFSALVRRDELETQARIKLFKELAEHFRNIVRFPSEATENCSDEQYIRNIVDILQYNLPIETNNDTLKQ